jgi:ATP/maltotriose-dependent transcriptional regulator MalT/DNA-binding SARP family transcriptional activator
VSSSEASGEVLYCRTKLLPPIPGPMLLERHRLIERLVSNLSHPLTLITADTGSGKTTLVADFVDKLAERFVWYQLDNADTDPVIFLSYITHGIRQIDPEFGTATLAYLRQEGAKISRCPESAVDILINEIIEKIEHQLILVLDDYDQLGADTPIHAVVDRMLARLPELLHTIIISRVPPPLHLARLRAQGALAIIDRSELLFTGDEMNALFRTVFDLKLTPTQLDEYHKQTEGWISALQLIHRLMQRQSGQPLPLEPILRTQAGRDILDQSADVLFSAESDEVQQFLIKLSLVEQIELEACSRLYPDLDCAALFAALVRRNLFITVASDGSSDEYRVHPSFQGFLRRSSRARLGREGVAAEHARIAGDFLEHGDWEQATRHLLATDDLEGVATVIAERGRDWIASGRVTALVSSVDALPACILERFPRALIYRAEVERLRSEYDTAKNLLDRAVKLLRDRNDREGEAEALHSLAAIAQRRGEVVRALEYLERATELAVESASLLAMCGNTRGVCLFTLKRWEEAEGEYREALQLAEEQQNEHLTRIILNNLGLSSLARNNYEEALNWLLRLLHDYKRCPPSPLDAMAHLNAARCYFLGNELDACESHLAQALEHCLQFNLIGLEIETLEAFASLHGKRGEAAGAADYMAQAARLADEVRIDLKAQELLDGQAAFTIALLPPQHRKQLTAVRGSSMEMKVSKPPAGLAIRMLGPVEIIRDSLPPITPITEDAWTTKRARAIFCFIASRRYCCASKEAIFETFWNEEESEAITRNFHPTVARIRRALNINHPLRHNFLLYREGDYLLNPDFAYQIDLQDFDRLLAESEEARRAGQLDRCISCSEAAIQLYRGEFMQGYADQWVQEQRRYYRDRYLCLLDRLVQAAQKAEEWPRSLRFALLLLRDDPFREDIHCCIMRAYAEQGNRVAINEQYETLCSLLRTALDVEPSAETTKFYRHLST